MAVMGRPHVEHVKELKIGFRVTKEERAKLDEYCARKNLTQTQVLTEALELLYKTKP